MSGILYIVATPIGNLEDITLRALRILKDVACVYAEDTRMTRKLLSHYEISVPCERYDERFPESRKRGILARCQAGEDLALVSDAGTPIISDPGWGLVALAREMGIIVVPLPGACSPIVALSACGLPIARFSFIGFLPRTPGKVRRALEAVRDCGCLICLESPHRLLKTLETLVALDIPGLEVCVARELTKKFEEIVRGSPQTVAAHFKNGVQGECCLIVYVKSH